MKECPMDYFRIYTITKWTTIFCLFIVFPALLFIVLLALFMVAVGGK
jgi:hypothetical protein